MPVGLLARRWRGSCSSSAGFATGFTSRRSKSWSTPGTTHSLTNGTIDILEEFRLVAKAWLEARPASTVAQVVVQRVAPPLASYAEDTSDSRRSDFLRRSGFVPSEDDEGPFEEP